MKIEHLRSEIVGTRPRVAATVRWEDCGRPAHELYFETTEEFASGLSCNPHAFLTGCILPAMYHGEERVFIDEEICPDLRNNLITAMTLIRHWYYGPDRSLVRIETKTKSSLPIPRTAERAGFFFSGGVDCLGTLRFNRLNYPLKHPLSIKDGLFIYGQNIESDNRPETFQQAVIDLSEVSRDAGITLIPVYTNIRQLDEDKKLFDINHGAILGAVAHVFAKRLTDVSISASDSIPGLSLVNHYNFKPHGSHPLLDPNYSSSDLRVRHADVTLSRLDKTRLIADWEVALQNIRVCGPNWPGNNCGRCEKCIRTMLALLAAGVLNRTRAFPGNDVTEKLVSAIKIKKPVYGYTVDDDYLELLAPLAERGRHDLVHAIEQLLKRSHSRKKSLKTRMKQLDSKYLNSNLVKLKRTLISNLKDR
jgi:hypothetical protein